jgi:hypothetical protein
MLVSPLFELLCSSKTILQKRVPCLLTPHTPETTITPFRHGSLRLFLTEKRAFKTPKQLKSSSLKRPLIRQNTMD